MSPSRRTVVGMREKRGRVRALSLVFGITLTASLFGCGSPGGTFLPFAGRSMDAATLRSLTESAALRNKVPAALVTAVIDAESHGDPSAVSRAGAEGIMQLMPGTALTYGVANPFDPVANVDGGTRYLHDLLHRYRGNIKLALAAYNAGPGAVDAAHGIPPFPETRAYVARVVGELTAR